MNSFWGNATGEEAELVKQIEPIPDKTICKVSAREVKYEEYEGVEKVKLQLVVMDGEYKDRIVFANLKINDEREDTRAAHIDALMRLFILTGQPVPANKPTPGELMGLCMKPIKVRVMLWEMNGKKGNWVSAYYPADYTPQNEKEKTPVFDSEDQIPF